MSKHRDPFANSNALYEDRNKEPEQKMWISVLAVAMNVQTLKEYALWQEDRQLM